MVRRISSGQRADVFLAVAARGAGEGGWGPPTRSGESVDAGSAPLVALRVYRDDVDDVSIATELAVMEEAAGAGVPALIDVATSTDGARVLVVERIAGPTVGQLLIDRAIEPGEAVTLVAPVVDAVARLADRDFAHVDLTAFDVRLDAAGRPRLLGLDGIRRMPSSGAERTAMRRDALLAMSGYVEAVIAAVRPAGVFEDARRLMGRPLEARPFEPFERELERAMFAAAAAVPISGAVVARAPRVPTRMVPPLPSTEPDAAPGAGEHPVRSRRGAGLMTAGGGLLDVAEMPAPLLERLADSVDGARFARPRVAVSAWMRRHRRTFVVAALVGAGALVVLLTAVPPAPGGGGTKPDAIVTVPSEAAEAPDRPPSPTAGAVEQTGEPDGLSGSVAPADAAALLIRRRAACFADLDPECLRPLVQPGSAIEASDWHSMIAARDGGPEVPELDPEYVEVVAEMGAAVLVRVAAAGQTEPASLLMVRSEAGWRLREMFD